MSYHLIKSCPIIKVYITLEGMMQIDSVSQLNMDWLYVAEHGEKPISLGLGQSQIRVDLHAEICYYVY